MKTKTAPDAPSAKEVLAQFEKLADPQTKKTLLRHCIPEPVLGVKIGAMKKIQKKLRNHHALALELYESGIYDVMYFAGLIADSRQVTKAELQRWLDRAPCGSIAVYTVGALAAESSAGLELAMKWIESPRERVASAGWATLAGIAGHVPDDKLPIAGFRKLIARVEKEIHQAPEDVRSQMNRFIIAVGGGIAPLSDTALAAARRIGKVEVDMGDTACKVPAAPAYIEKIKAMGRLGHKREHVRC